MCWVASGEVCVGSQVWLSNLKSRFLVHNLASLHSCHMAVVAAVVVFLEGN